MATVKQTVFIRIMQGLVMFNTNIIAMLEMQGLKLHVAPVYSL